MQPEELQQIKEKIFHRHGDVINKLAADGSEVVFVHDDGAMKAEANAAGFRVLDYIGKFVVWLFKSETKKVVIYLLLAVLGFGNVMCYFQAKPEDIQPATQEFTQSPVQWHQRYLAVPADQRNLYLVIPPGEENPHVPEEDYTTVLIKPWSIVAPVSGYSGSAHYPTSI